MKRLLKRLIDMLRAAISPTHKLSSRGSEIDVQPERTSELRQVVGVPQDLKLDLLVAAEVEAWLEVMKCTAEENPQLGMRWLADLDTRRKHSQEQAPKLIESPLSVQTVEASRYREFERSRYVIKRALKSAFARCSLAFKEQKPGVAVPGLREYKHARERLEQLAESWLKDQPDPGQEEAAP
jgi:hypothetical protein